MKDLIKPNWGQCNVNISATLAEFLGAPNKNKILPISLIKKAFSLPT